MSYEQKGECFFIPFGSEDVDGEYNLDTGDEVYFFIATDKRYVEYPLEPHGNLHV